MLLEEEEGEVFEAEEVEAEAVEEGEEKEVVEIKVELLKQMLNVSKMWRRVLSGEASIDELEETASSRAVLKPAPRPPRGGRKKASAKKGKAESKRKGGGGRKRKARKTGK
ncbi:hypothetical protein [Thermosphaera sp.]